MSLRPLPLHALLQLSHPALTATPGCFPLRVGPPEPVAVFAGHCSTRFFPSSPPSGRIHLISSFFAVGGQADLNRSLCEVQAKAQGLGLRRVRRVKHFRAIYVDEDEDGGLIDAPVSEGDGFSFVGGKYSEETGAAGEWERRGKYVNAFTDGQGAREKAKDPVFGLPMAESSQVSSDVYRWFYVEEGEEHLDTVILLHGLPSGSYSFRNVLPILAEENLRVITVDWLGFGLSDKPQPGYGFNYTMAEYSIALAALLQELKVEAATIVVQGFFAPAAMMFAFANPDKVKKLVLINAPITLQHTKLPGSLNSFTGFLLGEIFAQDPLRASDRLLAESGAYAMEEEDAMVYRCPYLTSGMAGFALTAVTRGLKMDLPRLIPAAEMRMSSSSSWSIPTTVIWGRRDKWLPYDYVPKFCRNVAASLIELNEVGHHAQEDFGEEVAKVLRTVARRKL